MTDNIKYFLRWCVIMVMVDAIFSIACTSNIFCRSEPLTSSVKTQLSYMSTKRLTSTILNVTALQKSNVKSEQHCLKNCIASTECLSINLVTSLNSGKTEIECQLLSQQSYANINNLVHQENSLHLTSLHAGCEKNLCMNNATCVPNYIDGTSTCKCQSTKFEGTLCEKELKVVSLKYNRGNYGFGADIVSMMKDSFYQKNQQSSTCLLDFKDSISSGVGSQLFAYFIPPQTGIYYFTVSCSASEFCRLYILTPGKQDRRILLNNGGISSGVYLEKYKKKFLEMLASVRDCVQNYGCYSNTYSLAVQLPNGTLFDPISNTFLASFF